MAFDHDKERLRKVGWKPTEKKNSGYNRIEEKREQSWPMQDRQYSINDLFSQYMLYAKV